MKYLKMLGMLAVVAAMLTAFAASASATTLTSPTGTNYVSTEGSEKTLTAVNSGNVSLDGLFTTVVCSKSHVKGKVETSGAGVTAKGTITELTFGTKEAPCNFPVTVEAKGTLEVHSVKTVEFEPEKFGVEACISGYCTGTLTSTGAKVKIETSVGNCVFTTNGTDIGLVRPSNDTGGKAAVLDIGAHGTGKIPRTEGNFLCGTQGQWTGGYEVTAPSTLWID